MGTSVKQRTVVGASFNDDELEELDRQRVRLGTDESGRPRLSRAGALKLVWEKLGDDAVDAARAQQALAAAGAQAVQPLADALDSLSAAWAERAHQRQMIGANANQIARFANTLRLALRDGDTVNAETVESLALALNGIERQLAAQAAAETEDGRLRDAVRDLLDQLKAAS